MARLLWITLFAVFINTSCYKPSTQQSFDDLKILEGRWQTIEGPEFIEVWEIINDSVLEGIGLSMNGADTSFKEYLKIYRRGDEIYYAAQVGSGVDYVPFRLEETKKNFWLFLNPEHDYPNIIEYSFLDDSTLQARTMNKRRKKELKFVMRKVN